MANPNRKRPMAELIEKLRAALVDAETDINDCGHAWLYGDQICGEAGLRLIASHRQLLEDHRPIDDGPSRAWFIGCNVCSFRDRYEELQVEFPCADVRRVAEFWLGSTE